MDRIRWTLLVLCALRWGATLVPAGCVWGIDAQRWVAPALAWPLMAAMALAVLGALRSRRPFTDFAFDPGPARALWPLALGAIVLVLVGAVPDRLRFVGDFGLRAGILESRNGFETIFPQALPLDRLVNHVLPVALGARLGLEPIALIRVLGLLEAALWVALSVRLARLLAPGEPVAFVLACMLAFGGPLTLFSGYSKPTPQVLLCALGVATFGCELVLRGRGTLGLALATSAGIAIHRGGLPLLVPFGVAHAVAWPRGGTDAVRWRRLALAVVPLVVLGAEAPRLLHVIRGFDLPVNFVPGGTRPAGVWGNAFAPVRLADDLSAILLHAPLAPLGLCAPRGAWRSPAGAFLGSLALAFMPVLLFVFLPLGPFRDYDSLGGEGVALAVIAAWAVARRAERAPLPRGIAAALVASAFVPFVLLLVSLHDLDRGFAKARSIASGPPERSATQRASVLDWIGVRALNEERFPIAHAAFRDLCRETPIPHALKLWGASALIVGQPREAETAFTRVLATSPMDPLGRYLLAVSANLAGDSLTAHREEAVVQRWADAGPEMRTVVEFIDHYPRLYAVVRQTSAR